MTEKGKTKYKLLTEKKYQENIKICLTLHAALLVFQRMETFRFKSNFQNTGVPKNMNNVPQVQASLK